MLPPHVTARRSTAGSSESGFSSWLDNNSLVGNTGAKAAASDSTLPDPTAAKYNYAEGLHKTLIFFESMRSGILDRQRLAW